MWVRTRVAGAWLKATGALALAAAVLIGAVLLGQQPAGPRDGGTAPTPTATAPATPAPTSGQTATPQLSVEEALGLALAPGAMERVTYAPGEDIERAGLYFLNVATGVSEGWALAATDQPLWQLSPGSGASRDNRFAVAQGLIVDRQTGHVYRYDIGQTTLVHSGETIAVPPVYERSWSLGPAARHGRLIFYLPALRQFAVVQFGQAEPRILSTFHRAAEFQAVSVRALFSPDGQRIAVVADVLMLVEAETGRTTAIGERPLPRDPRPSLMLLPLRDDTFIVAARLGTLAWARYTWEGQRLAAAEVRPNMIWSGVYFSPDGAHVAWAEQLSTTTPWLSAVIVRDGMTGQPLFRAVGASFCHELLDGDRWLADGSALVAIVQAGVHWSEHLIDIAGTVAPRGHFTGIPAPDRTDRFFTGNVIDLDGNLLASIRAPGRIEETLWFHPWGESSNEARFVTPHFFGRGGRCYGWSGGPEPVMERAPFTQSPTQRLSAPGDRPELAGVLRAEPDPDATATASISYPIDVAILAMVDRAVGSCGEIWAHVRTADGQQGWVYVAPRAMHIPCDPNDT